MAQSKWVRHEVFSRVQFCLFVSVLCMYCLLMRAPFLCLLYRRRADYFRRTSPRVSKEVSFTFLPVVKSGGISRVAHP